MNELLRRLLFLPRQGTAFARELDHLHFLVISVTVVGATGVAMVGALFLFKYRRRTKVVPVTPRVVVSGRVEAAVITATLALFVGFWVLGFRQYRRLADPPTGALTIYVAAKQWMWEFSYPNGPASAGILTVPAGRPVELLMTSRDVIHSFYVPEFRVKQDVVPGRYTTIWFTPSEPGSYQILCAEYCGAGHSTMRGEVVALSGEDYERWLQGTSRPTDGEADPTSLATVGRRVAAERGCLRCHTLDGTAYIGPSFAGLLGRRERLASGASVLVTPGYVTKSMMDPQADVVAGFKSVMPSYQGLITAGETAAIVELLHSLEDVPRQPEQQVFPEVTGRGAPDGGR